MGTVKQNHGVERATDTLDILGESAIWCGIDNVLYWVDIRAPALRRLEPQTGQVTSWAMNDLCAAVMLSTDRRLLLAMRLGLFAFDPADNARRYHRPECPELEPRQSRDVFRRYAGRADQGL
jgi:sugar lactone lactonase YvrE